MPKGHNNNAKMDAAIIDFPTFSKQAKIEKLFVFLMENTKMHQKTIEKSIQNRSNNLSKIYQESTVIPVNLKILS